MEFNCYACSKTLNFPDGYTISRQEECEFCSASLHVCKMCEFYDQSAYNDCRETSADRITEKDKANFCDYYKPNLNLKDQSDKKQSALDAAEALFKK